MACLKHRSSNYRASKVALPNNPALISIEAVANPIARSDEYVAGIGDWLVQDRVGQRRLPDDASGMRLKTPDGPGGLFRRLGAFDYSTIA